MKRKLEFLLLTLIFLGSLSILHKAYAQELSPLAKLAQEYILRLNNPDVGLKETTIVNPDQILKSAVEESIETVTKTVNEVEQEKQRVVTDVKDTVKQDIDDSIVEIRKTTEKPAYELQRSIDVERTELFENITRTVDAINPIETGKIKEVEIQVNNSLQKIQTNLEKESGTIVDFDRSKRDVKNSFIRFEEVLTQKKQIIESREGSLVFQDSDEDGLSDYDELYIYRTDPNNARTREGEKNDGEKILLGLNPLSDVEEQINYQDPREDKESFVSSSYKVDKVQLVKEEKEKLVFEGVALPNTFVTLYIYSTPIVVNVKTDDSGTWTYELEQELENGEHQIYVATVDNTGKIVARSNPILFTKTADAASVGIAGGLQSSVTTENFLKDNFILITLALLISIVILSMMFVGNHRNIKAAVADLKNEI